MLRKLFLCSFLGVFISVLFAGIFTPVVFAAPENVKVIIAFDRQPGSDEEALVERTGGTINYTYDIIPALAATIPETAVEGIRKNPRVIRVEPDIIMHAYGQTLPTGVDRIEVDNNSTAKIDGINDGLDVDIAIIDTGIDTDHPDLNVIGGTHFYTVDTGPPWERGARQDDNYDDDNGHGSHVAGIAAALDNETGVVGVAPGASLWAVKVLDSSGSGYLSDIIAGIEWVTEKAGTIEVANMSLGGQGYNQSFRDAITNSITAGITYVVSAGNDGVDVYGLDGVFGTGDDIIPAAFPEVATISAMADSDGQPGGSGSDTSYGSDDSFASFSNYSNSVVSDNPVQSPGAAMDLLLPGVDIYSTYKDGGYTTMSGTSMSSPHGAGLAALYIAQNGSATNATGVYAIRQALIDNGVAQDSNNGLAILNDPDSNWEYIGWAGSVVGTPPSVAWMDPQDGAMVAGTVTIQIDASDTEDTDGSLTVEWRIDNNTWQTTIYNTDTGYYEDTWDTIALSDSDYTLDAQATDSDGNTVISSITVTTDNVDNAPTVAWVNPQEGDAVSGTVTIQIDASDDRDSGSNLTVEWQVNDGTWQTTSYNSTTSYYEFSWNTETVSDGGYTLDARATDTGGNTSPENGVAVTVSNIAGGMYVWDISFKETGPHLKSIVTVLNDSDADGVAESSDGAVSDALVYFTFTNTSTAETQTYNGTTNSDGQVEFQWKRASGGDYKAEVTDITHDQYTYTSSMDADNPDYYTLGGTSAGTSLISAFPNPANPETSISYSISQSGQVTLKVYNTLGQLVRTLVDEIKAPGVYTTHWNGRDESGNNVSSGVYFYQLRSGTYMETKSMSIIR